MIRLMEHRSDSPDPEKRTPVFVNPAFITLIRPGPNGGSIVYVRAGTSDHRLLVDESPDTIRRWTKGRTIGG